MASEFDDLPQEERKLSDYLEASNEKNVADLYAKQDVLSVSGDVGIVNQIEFQGRSFAGASVSNYGIVNPGDVVYTKSPLSANPFGIIKTNKGKAGIVSTLYAVYLPKKNTYPDFIQDYFSQDARVNKYLHPLVNKGAKNDMKVSADNALKGFVWFPDYDEQKRISELFADVERLITLHQREHDKTVNIKKALLEKMFAEEGENKPQIRFAGFTGAWEQREFAELVSRASTMSDSKSDMPRVEYEDIIPGQGQLNKNIYEKQSNKRGIHFEPGDVLFGKLRPYLQNWLAPDFTGIAVGDWWVLKPQDVNTEFICALLQSPQYQRISNLSTGTKMPRSDWSVVARTSFAVPSQIYEQAQIGKTFSNLDRLIAQHQRKLSKLQNIKKALLEKMFV